MRPRREVGAADRGWPWWRQLMANSLLIFLHQPVKFHEQPNPGYGTQRHVSRDSRLENFVSKGDFSRIVLLADISASQPLPLCPYSHQPPHRTVVAADWQSVSEGDRLISWLTECKIAWFWQLLVNLSASEFWGLDHSMCNLCFNSPTIFIGHFIWGLQIDQRQKFSYCNLKRVWERWSPEHFISLLSPEWCV